MLARILTQILIHQVLIYKPDLQLYLQIVITRIIAFSVRIVLKRSTEKFKKFISRELITVIFITFI